MCSCFLIGSSWWAGVVTIASGRYFHAPAALRTYTVTASARGYRSSSRRVTVAAGVMETLTFVIAVGRLGSILGAPMYPFKR